MNKVIYLTNTMDSSRHRFFTKNRDDNDKSHRGQNDYNLLFVNSLKHKRQFTEKKLFLWIRKDDE